MSRRLITALFTLIVCAPWSAFGAGAAPMAPASGASGQGAPAGVDVNQLHVGWRGAYTAPPVDRSHPGGVPNPHERRADIMFAETAPMTPVSVSAGSSATARTGP
jgi:hypothetical protein